MREAVKIRTVCLVLMIFAAAGCAAPAVDYSSGNANLTDANIERIQAGMDADEVMQILGEPDEETRNAAGRDVWIYRRSTGRKEPGRMLSSETRIRAMLLTLTLHPAGKVENVAYDELKETVS